MFTWENLQARLFHLGWLGEELPAFVATPGGAWLFRELVREAQAVAELAAQYVAECERAGLTGPDGDTPTTPATWRRTTTPDDPTTEDTTTGVHHGPVGPVGGGGVPDSRAQRNGGGAA